MKLKAGDIIDLKEGHKVYANVPKHLVYSNCKGDFSLARSGIKIGDEFCYVAGRYVVYETKLDGGSGPGARDPFPNGWHVFCIRMSDGFKVDFYQSGCFTAMIEPSQIAPVFNAHEDGPLPAEAK